MTTQTELVHLYAGPADYPNTLCPRGRPWAKAYAAVHPKDLDLVDCQECLQLYELPDIVAAEPHPRKYRRDPIVTVCAVGVAVIVALWIVWRWGA